MPVGTLTPPRAARADRRAGWRILMSIRFSARFSVRRWTTLAGALAFSGFLLVQPGFGGPASAATEPTWQQRWAPDPTTDGLGGFETVEDDRADSHKAGQPHIFVEGDSYRFNMHKVDRDISTDRQRNEVRGMRTGGYDLILLKGSTWRFTQSMFIPASLKGTTKFTHIMQMKVPGTGSGPIMTMSLRRSGSTQKIQIEIGGSTVGSTNLVPLQNKWIDMELELTIGDKPNGKVHWVLRDGAKTVVDATKSGVDTWVEDRVRPKWGIYRSLGDTSGSIQDTYLLLKNMRAYEWSADPNPPLSTRYEAEAATLSKAVVQSNHEDFTGTGFVNYDNVSGSYAQWTVNAPVAGNATLTFRYSNGTSANEAMDIRVNDTVVSKALAFKNTLSWDEWDTRTVTAKLVAGTNTIRATATTGNGGPNLDNVLVEVTPAA
jgi:Carbohydrate binding module (family 6)/Polysaccharide lyase